MKRAVVTAVLGATVLSGCVHPPQIGEPAPSVADGKLEDSYRDLVEHFSTHQELFNVFDTRLFAGATFLSYSLLEAQAARKAAFEALPLDQANVLTGKAHEEAAGAVEFFFGASVVDYHFDDFDSRKSHWVIHLVTETGSVAPVSVERVGRADVNLRAYYPYLGDYWVGYKMKFPTQFPDGRPVLTGGPQTLRLVLGSTYGQLNLAVPAR